MNRFDRILIEGLEVQTVIGIYDWEREIRQTVRIDVEMAWDITAAAASDAIADALDYKAVAKRLITFIEASNYGLIEALAGSRALHVPQPSPDTRPTFVRLPVIARDEATRTRAVDRLRREGIGASAFYPRAICDIENIGSHMPGPAIHCEKAERLARTLFTVPVHPLVNHRDTEKMIGVLTAV